MFEWSLENKVALHVGAWIEVLHQSGRGRELDVALLVGAWMEIVRGRLQLSSNSGRVPDRRKGVRACGALQLNEKMGTFIFGSAIRWKGAFCLPTKSCK
jgi:hypothetical protein